MKLLDMFYYYNIYTLGTAADKNSFLKSTIDTTSTTSSELDYEIFEIERGGQATYHGPGQLVMYPIIDLNNFQKDINIYLRGLEEITIQTLSDYNIQGKRKEGLTGVWVNNQQLCAIGIKIRRWVTIAFIYTIKEFIRVFSMDTGQEIEAGQEAFSGGGINWQWSNVSSTPVMDNHQRIFATISNNSRNPSVKLGSMRDKTLMNALP